MDATPRRLDASIGGNTMADDADHAANLQQAENDAAVARHRAKPAAAGRRACATCKKAVSELRRRNGAQLCIKCQTDAELFLRGRGQR